MNNIKKFTLYGLLVGIVYSIIAMGPFLLCKLTGIWSTSSGSGIAKISYCGVNFLLKPFASFYVSLARGKGLFFSASNFVLVGEVLLMILTFVIIGLIVGLIFSKRK